MEAMQEVRRVSAREHGGASPEKPGSCLPEAPDRGSDNAAVGNRGGSLPSKQAEASEEESFAKRAKEELRAGDAENGKQASLMRARAAIRAGK